MSDTMPAPLSDSEVARVITETLKHAGADGHTDPEMARATELLERMVVESTILEAWREGLIEVGYNRHDDTLVWVRSDKVNA